MKKSTVIAMLIGIISIFALVVMLLKVLSNNFAIAEEYQKIKQEIEETQCEEHEIIITSEYNFLLDKYKTISKCVKCGKKW